MGRLYDRVKMTVTTIGTETVTLGSVVPGFRSFLNAGVPEGGRVHYVLEDDEAWEVGEGIYSLGTLTRDPSASSDGGEAIILSGNAVVFIAALARDFVQEMTLAGSGSNPVLETVNGTMATIVLTQDVTLTDALAEGESILLLVDNTGGYTVTYPVGTKWQTGVPPTLDQTKENGLVMWKLNGQLYGSYMGVFA